jgi:hypothetical protein
MSNIFTALNWRDVAIGSCIALVLACASYAGSNIIPQKITSYAYFDKWYDGDLPRVYSTMAERFGNGHESTRKHPLFLLASQPAVSVAKKAFGIGPAVAIKLVMSLLAYVSVLVLYTCLRLMTLRRIDAVLLCLLFGSSAAAMFWFTVPETFPFGALSILLAVLTAVASQRWPLPSGCYVLVNIATFACTITNWMAGIIATLASCPIRRAARIIAVSLALATLLWVGQKRLYPDAAFFLGGTFDYWNTNLAHLHPLRVTASMFYHTMVMPGITYIDDICTGPGMRTQSSLPGSASVLGFIAVALWTIVLLVGLKALIFMKEHRTLRVTIGVFLLFEIALHVLYGSETFLYSSHVVAILIPMAGFGFLTGQRRAMTALVAALIVCASLNNGIQFETSAQFIEATTTNVIPRIRECAVWF